MESTKRPTAVVWCAPGMAPPGELLKALDRGGLNVQAANSPFLALAHLCRLQRQSTQISRGTRSVALVLVNPEEISGAAAVCEAAERYAPGSRAWMYAAGSNQRLRGISDADIARWRVVISGPSDAKGPSVTPRTSIPTEQATIPSENSPYAKRVQVLPLRSPAGAEPGTGGGNTGRMDSRTSLKNGSKLRLTDAPEVEEAMQTADVDLGAGETGVSQGRPRSVLTSEELDMLLNDEQPGS